jgi:hypothetical protein
VKFAICAIATTFVIVSSLSACGSSSNDTPAGGGTKASGGTGGGSAGAGGDSGGSGGSGGVAGSGGTSLGGASGSAGSGGEAGGVDADGDGIDDASELQMAEDYFPYFSLNPSDNCTRHGVLFRLSPHPDDATKIAIWYDVLYENDCGLGGHVGDDEMFGMVIDPKTPPPAGILAMRGISHQGTACEDTTTCGSLPNCGACTTAQKGSDLFPVVFAAVNKHGNYVDQDSCNTWWCDLGGCALNSAPDLPLFVNAGEPGRPLSNNLTTNGFITAANGWTQAALMNFDPWGNTDFGGAGNVTDDLQDMSFIVAPSGC